MHHDCEHHVLLGHLDDYESYNPQVLEFVKKYTGLTGQQIRDDAAWQKAAAKKPKHLDQMSATEMDAFKKMLDAEFPPNTAVMAKAVAVRIEEKGRTAKTPSFLPRNKRITRTTILSQAPAVEADVR
ncbi:MAG TPA: hypothetical protein VKU37_13525 [Verrucomicrobiae bacterium]|nr:hypothetical protein [Verrucomicrobiae bacterium]